jgi:hypothetical protein
MQRPLASLALSLVLCSCVTDGNRRVQRAVTVSVSVTLHGSPVEGAIVKHIRSAPPNVMLGRGTEPEIDTTDRSGCASFLALANDAVLVSVQYPSAGSEFRQLVVSTDATMSVELMPQLSVMGSVVDTEGRPVPAASVSVSEDGFRDFLDVGVASVDTWGHFQLGGLKLGHRYHVSSQCPGYLGSDVAVVASMTAEPVVLTLRVWPSGS